MDPLMGAALITGGANLLGGGLGFLGGQSANAANTAFAYEQLQAQQQQFNQSMDFAREQFGFQEYEVANQVQQRVGDARLAGVSPLVALGMNPVNVSPIQVGGDISGGGPGAVNPASSLAASLSSAGSDISRAMSVAKTPEERAFIAARTEATRASLESQGVDNDYKRSMIALNNARVSEMLSRPAFPGVQNDTGRVIPGQGSANNAGPFQVVPARIEGRAGGTGGVTAGVQAADSVERTAGGFYQVTPARGSVAGQGDAYEAGAAFARNRLFVAPGTAAPPYVVSKMQMDDPTVTGGIHVGAGYYYPLHSSDYDAVRRATHPEGAPYQPF